MLGTAITHLVQKVGSLISSVTEYLTQKLLQLRGVLTALKTQFAALSNLFNQLVSAVQKVKALLVLCITQVQSIKVVLTNVLTKVGVTGQPSATTAPQTPQPVTRKRKKGL